MPIYEYRHPETGETRSELRPISECKEDFVDDEGVVWKRILGPTPTTFRFNDSTGFKGLDKRVNRK
jgi:hypothetical protein